MLFEKSCLLVLVCLSMSSLSSDIPLMERMKAIDTVRLESFNNCQDPK
ncbi:MAG: hypothetical protein ACI9LX_003905 [Paraglaciecola sp.]|jgi:hypothetical protein